jgi:hypothetical protein
LGKTADHARGNAEGGDGGEKDKAARRETAHQRNIDHDRSDSIWITGAGGATLAG